jgi:predicted dehydrogenase
VAPHADVNAGTQLYGERGFASPSQPAETLTQTAAVKSGPGGFIFPREPHLPQSVYDIQMKSFLDCILEDRIPSPGGQEGWANMKVVDAAYESSRTGKVVEIK